MSFDANNSKPKLTLLKRSVPPVGSLVEEFDMELELDLERDISDFEFPELPVSPKKNISRKTDEFDPSFSDLLRAQKDCVDRINYFASELEFNLD